MQDLNPVRIQSARSRAMRRWGTAAAVTLGVAALLAPLKAEDGLYLKAKTDITQIVRQSTWDRALANQPAETQWPWDETASSKAPSVPRLGLSAAVLKSSAEDEASGLSQPAQQRLTAAADARDPHLDLGGVTVGDRITVTTADGLSHIYKVTGRQMTDAGQSELDAAPANADAPTKSCWPLDNVVAGALRIVIEAVNADARPRAVANPEL